MRTIPMLVAPHVLTSRDRSAIKWWGDLHKIYRRSYSRDGREETQKKPSADESCDWVALA